MTHYRPGHAYSQPHSYGHSRMHNGNANQSRFNHGVHADTISGTVVQHFTSDGRRVQGLEERTYRIGCDQTLHKAHTERQFFELERQLRYEHRHGTDLEAELKRFERFEMSRGGGGGGNRNRAPMGMNPGRGGGNVGRGGRPMYPNNGNGNRPAMRNGMGNGMNNNGNGYNRRPDNNNNDNYNDDGCCCQ